MTPRIHSFIVKLWLESPDSPDDAGWHGQISHVPGGERRAIRDLNAIAPFIEEQVGPVGHARPSWLSRLWQRFGRGAPTNRRSRRRFRDDAMDAPVAKC